MVETALKHIIILLLLGQSAFGQVILGNAKLQNAQLGLTVASGGGGVWYDQLASADANNNNGLEPGTLLWCEKTLASGSCIKLRIEVSAYASTTNIKLGIYNLSGNLLQMVIVPVTGNGITEGSITSTSVTAVTFYLAFIPESNTASVRWKDGVGTTHYNTSVGVYTMPSTLPTDEGPLTRSYVIGAFVQ